VELCKKTTTTIEYTNVWYCADANSSETSKSSKPCCYDKN